MRGVPLTHDAVLQKVNRKTPAGWRRTRPVTVMPCAGGPGHYREASLPGECDFSGRRQKNARSAGVKIVKKRRDTQDLTQSEAMSL